jgi:hypothetical protein
LNNCEGVLKRWEVLNIAIEVTRPGKKVILQALNMIHWQKAWIELSRDKDEDDCYANEEFEQFLDPLCL